MFGTEELEKCVFLQTVNLCCSIEII